MSLATQAREALYRLSEMQGVRALDSEKPKPRGLGRARAFFDNARMSTSRARIHTLFALHACASRLADRRVYQAFLLKHVRQLFVRKNLRASVQDLPFGLAICLAMSCQMKSISGTKMIKACYLADVRVVLTFFCALERRSARSSADAIYPGTDALQARLADTAQQTPCGTTLIDLSDGLAAVLGCCCDQSATD